MRTFIKTHWKLPWILVGILLFLNSLLLLSHFYTTHAIVSRWLFLWFLAIASDGIAALWSGLSIWSLRGDDNDLAYFYSILLFAITIEDMFALIANMVPVHIIGPYPLWFVVWFWTGRAIKSYAVWMVALFHSGTVQ